MILYINKILRKSVVRKILKFILGIYYRIKSSKEQRRIFAEVQPGDMIWAKMPLKKKELKKIEENHRVRPYLVVGKTKNMLICYQSSSKPSVKLNNYEEYYIKKEKYGKKRDSWLNFTKSIELPICNIKNRYISVSEFDLKEIEKRLQVMTYRRDKKVEKFDINVEISEGDVVDYNKGIYYIYAADNSYVYGIKIYRRNTYEQESDKIIINRKTYYSIKNDTKKEAIKRTANLKIIDIAYKDEMEVIKTIKNRKKEKKEQEHVKKKVFNNGNITEIKVGTVFKVGKSKILYLFQKDNKYYGIDTIYYIIAPRIIEIKNITKRKILEVKSKEECIKYIEAILKDNNNLYKDLKKVYKEFKVNVCK